MEMKRVDIVGATRELPITSTSKVQARYKLLKECTLSWSSSEWPALSLKVPARSSNLELTVVRMWYSPTY